MTLQHRLCYKTRNQIICNHNQYYECKANETGTGFILPRSPKDVYAVIAINKSLERYIFANVKGKSQYEKIQACW